MAASFVNDPSFESIPAVGSGSVLLGLRTACGDAVRWEPGGDATALAAFLGDLFRALDGIVYEREPDSGTLTPVEWLLRDTVLIKPPAGPIIVCPAVYLVQQYALVVEGAVVGEDAGVDGVALDVADEVLLTLSKDQLVDLAGRRGVAVSGTKGELVARLLAPVVEESEPES